MSYQFYSDSATLKIVENGQVRNLAKGLIGIRDFGNYIIISYDGVDNYLKIIYTDVTVPANVSATDLREQIKSFLNIHIASKQNSFRIESTQTSVLIAASNLGRKEITIYNQANKILYLATYSPANTETPYQLATGERISINKYNGAFYGVWEDNPNGHAHITEFYD